MAAVRRAGGRFLAPEVDAHGFFLVAAGGGGGGVSRVLAEAEAPDAAVAGREPSPSSASAAVARITPAVLFVTVVLAVVLLASGLLHVLRRLFLKSNGGGAGGAERQLQQLFFPPHEDGAGGGGAGGGGGLDQAAIDALPEFAYGELAAAGKGKAKAGRPFDCAVCLCEFADDDRLRLLPVCGHAFHVACIDVWLRSSATCPLCRAALRRFAAAAAVASAPASASAADVTSSVGPDVEEQKQPEAPGDAAAASSVVLPVRLGRFKNLAAVGPDGAESSSTTSASPRLDGRRCFSMGSYQYVLSDEQFLVSVHIKNGNAVSTAASCDAAGEPAASGDDDDKQGKKAFARGDSFSVSKIWQWRGSQRRLPAGLCADDSLPWAPTPTTATRQDKHT